MHTGAPAKLSPLAYERKGAGEPVVLIHGIGHRRQGWAPVFDRLAEKYDVVAVDLAGFGESARYPKHIAYSVENACQDLAANFAEWGMERPHVVGNSLGGVLALELGSRGLVSSVTALSPAGFGSRLATARALALLGMLWLAAQLPDAVIRVLCRLRIGRVLTGALLYANPARQTVEGAIGDALSLKRSRAFGDVAQAGVKYPGFHRPIDVPVTIAWGTRDLILPFGQAKVARERLPHANHVTLKGAGHVPMIDEPDLIIELVEETIAAAAAEEGVA